MDDLEQADAVAFVLAHVRGDEELVTAMIAMHGLERLFPAAVGLLVKVLADSGIDAAALTATLTDWQDRRRNMFGGWR